MKVILQTKRLILREIEFTDVDGMFELDSDPDVHKYLGEPVVHSVEESIEKIKNIRGQYLTNGVGRFAVIEKSTGEFIGWAGIKLEEPRVIHPYKYYDIGYRLIKKYWGKGFATEAAKATLIYAFEQLKISELYADADSNNLASKNVLEKIGLKYIMTFDDDGFNVDWYKISNPSISDN